MKHHVLLDNLFGFDRPDSPGQRAFAVLFELFVLYWVVAYAWSWAWYIQRTEDVVLPLGVARYIDLSFMFNGVAPKLNAALMTLFAVVGVLRLWRGAWLACLLSFHLQYTARFCLGEISHGSNLIGLVVLGFGIAGVAFVNRNHARRFAIGFTYFFVGLGYTTAAICKLVATGLTWVNGRHLWLWVAERRVDMYSTAATFDYTFVQSLAIDSHLAATLILVFGLVAEAFGWAIWFRRSRPFAMALLIAMHLGIIWSMGISFTSNTWLLVLLAYPWARLIDRTVGRTSDVARQIVSPHGGVLTQE